MWGVRYSRCEVLISVRGIRCLWYEGREVQGSYGIRGARCELQGVIGAKDAKGKGCGMLMV